MLKGYEKSGFLSSPTGKMQSADEYGQVLMLGSQVVPWLLQLLKDGEGDTHVIFMMLHTLAFEHPYILHDDRGRVNVIKQAWLDLGAQRSWI